MTHLETNIFPITNLASLKTRYRLYKIRGLSKDHDEYEPNKQAIIKKFRYEMRKPATIITHDGEPHLALPEDAPEPRSPLQLVRDTAYFDKIPETLTLDYEHPTPQTAGLRAEFLQFAIQGALFRNGHLWQSNAGNPFFERHGTDVAGILVYRGYAIRVVPLPDGRLGLCVDVQHKYVAKIPLSATLTRDEFRKHKNARCIYHYGNQWYEIKLHDHAGLSITEQLIPDNGKLVPLLKYVMEHAPKPLPREVTDLPPASPTITYMTNRGEAMHVPAALCYQVYDTSDPRLKRTHRQTILDPAIRRQLIHTFVDKHLGTIRLNDTAVTIDKKPFTIKKQVFLPPDLAFGNNTVISMRGTTGATYVM